MKKSYYSQDAEQEALYLALTLGMIKQDDEYLRNWIRRVKKNKLANYERANKKYIFVQFDDEFDVTGLDPTGGGTPHKV